MSFWGEYRRELDKLQRLRVLRVALLTLLLLATGYVGFWSGRWVGGVDQQRLAALQTIRDAQETEQTQLRRAMVGLRLEHSVGSQASDVLRGNLKSLEDELAQVRDELVFYRSLMAPSKLAKGLQIAEFELFEKSSGEFTYHLLLTQVTDRRSRLSGKVRLQVTGLREGQTEVLPLTELSSPKAYPLAYRFRYFQDIKGDLHLPEGFEPQAVEVSVSGRGKTAVERSFVWSESIVSRRS